MFRRAKRFFCSVLPCFKESLQSGDLIIEDQSLGKHGFMNKLGSVCKISHMAGAVTVAGKNNGKIIFPAAAEDLPAAGPCVAPIAVGGKGRFIDLKDHILFLCAS